MNPFFIRKITYPAYRAIKRDNVLTYLDEMRTVQVMEPEAIREFQWSKLKALLEYAAAKVPYYRRVFKDMGAEPGDFKSADDLRSFPILRKGDVWENLEELIADCYPRDDLSHDETGGSTGQNLFFYVDRASSGARPANTVRMDEWLDARLRSFPCSGIRILSKCTISGDMVHLSSSPWSGLRERHSKI
jgi:phenylacetate-CoA ligase